MKLEVINIEGEKTGRSVDLPEEVFGVEARDHVLYLAVKRHQARQRQGTHKTKERNEIVGSTRKIKRQKGTGTARAGDIKNPLFRGGGRTFGPRPRDYELKVNKKTRRLARKAALSEKARSGQLFVIEDFSFDQPRTK
ncbi:MAG: 50S ribosomal protein L4, partial [Saprospiraceae bacterium]|nr:50S ribosomal protein L4 [Saprospiraceae bacterium]